MRIKRALIVLTFAVISVILTVATLQSVERENQKARNKVEYKGFFYASAKHIASIADCLPNNELADVLIDVMQEYNPDAYSEWLFARDIRRRLDALNTEPETLGRNKQMAELSDELRSKRTDMQNSCMDCTYPEARLGFEGSASYLTGFVDDGAYAWSLSIADWTRIVERTLARIPEPQRADTLRALEERAVATKGLRDRATEMVMAMTPRDAVAALPQEEREANAKAMWGHRIFLEHSPDEPQQGLLIDAKYKELRCAPIRDASELRQALGLPSVKRQ